MAQVPRVDEAVAVESEMHIEAAVSNLTPTVITFSWPCAHIIIATDGEIDVSFDSATIVAGHVNIKAGEIWCLDLAASGLSVQGVVGAGIEVRVFVSRDLV